MREEFDVPVGLSDHSLGVGVAPLAMGQGAAIIEKHFTLDRRLPGPDQELSIEPDELAELVTFAERAEATRADNDATVHSEEEEIREWAGHSIVTAKPVSAGERFDESNLTTKRPATGIPAERFFDVIGETAAQNIDSGSPLTEDDVKWS
jgi:N-acetylneuraminate synthase/N,N'-diacetyllegionaminate synthase